MCCLSLEFVSCKQTRIEEQAQGRGTLGLSEVVPPSPLYISFGEMSVKVLSPVFNRVTWVCCCCRNSVYIPDDVKRLPNASVRSYFMSCLCTLLLLLNPVASKGNGIISLGKATICWVVGGSILWATIGPTYSILSFSSEFQTERTVY